MIFPVLRLLPFFCYACLFLCLILISIYTRMNRAPAHLCFLCLYCLLGQFALPGKFLLLQIWELLDLGLVQPVYDWIFPLGHMDLLDLRLRQCEGVVV
jgi:hypothetical protein